MKYIIHISVSDRFGNTTKKGCRNGVTDDNLQQEMDIAMTTAKMEAKYGCKDKNGYKYPNIFVECVEID